METRAAFFSSFAAVGISKCASGGEPEVFIITLYRGKGEAFKVANWQKGWLLALSVLSLWRQRENGACEGQILLGAELAHFLIRLKEERIQFVLRVADRSTQSHACIYTSTPSSSVFNAFSPPPPQTPLLISLFLSLHIHTQTHTFTQGCALWVSVMCSRLMRSQRRFGRVAESMFIAGFFKYLMI